MYGRILIGFGHIFGKCKVAKLLYMELAAAPLDASKVTWIEDGGSRPSTFNFILK